MANRNEIQWAFPYSDRRADKNIGKSRSQFLNAFYTTIFDDFFFSFSYEVSLCQFETVVPRLRVVRLVRKNVYTGRVAATISFRR